MPEPGRTPQPQFEGLAYGENQRANAQAALIGDGTPVDPLEGFAPSSTGDQFLYGPTDRPDEPITAGAPFGPGQPVPFRTQRSDQVFLRDLSYALEQDPDADKTVYAFIDRVRKGL